MEKNTRMKIAGTTTVEKAFERFASMSEENRLVLNTSLKLKELMKQMVGERQFQGMTQRDFAEVVGMKQPMIARIERLESVPRLDTFIKMADKLDLEIVLASKVEYLPLDIDIKSIKYSSSPSCNGVYKNQIVYGRYVNNERVPNAA